MWAAAFWLLLLVWQWAANKRQQSLTRIELREACEKVLASRKQGSALEAQLAALQTQVLQLKDDKVISNRVNADPCQRAPPPSQHLHQLR